MPSVSNPFPQDSHASPVTLVIEDDPAQREALVTFLNLEGIRATGVASLQQAEQWLSGRSCDILILDLGLPDGDGLDWIGRRPELADTGIVMVTARGLPEERIQGIRRGADSYLVKPVNLEELTGIVRNLLRRLTRDRPQHLWSVDPLSWTLTAPNGMDVQLTRSETLVLSVLSQHTGQGTSRDSLISGLGHNPRVYDWRRMEILIRRLRSKVHEAAALELPLRTIYGFGYAFTEPLHIKEGKAA